VSVDVVGYQLVAKSDAVYSAELAPSWYSAQIPSGFEFRQKLGGPSSHGSGIGIGETPNGFLASVNIAIDGRRPPLAG